MWRQKVLTAKGGSDVASCQKFCWSGQSLAIAAVKQIFLDNKKLLISLDSLYSLYGQYLIMYRLL